MSSEETKKEDPGANEQISVKVVSNNGDEVVFKVKKTTPFKKIFDAYAQKTGSNAQRLKFLYEGARLKEAETPAEVGLDDGDTVEVMMDQVGGFGL